MKHVFSSHVKFSIRYSSLENLVYIITIIIPEITFNILKYALLNLPISNFLRQSRIAGRLHESILTPRRHTKPYPKSLVYIISFGHQQNNIIINSNIYLILSLTAIVCPLNFVPVDFSRSFHRVWDTGLIRKHCFLFFFRT